MPVIETAHESVVTAPAHLMAPAAGEDIPAPGTCARCRSPYWAPLMRSEPVEYRLCRRCGHVWVERAETASRPIVVEERRMRESLSSRLTAAAAVLLRLLSARRA